MSATGPTEENGVLPAPQVSDVLAFLPPADFSALELGMRQFLDGLAHLGQRLTSEQESASMYPWLVALAAAATACEIARRQLGESARTSLEGNGSLGFPSNHLFPG